MLTKWIEALESGNYEQTTGDLCCDGKFCCLGVACEVYQKEVGDLKIEAWREVRVYDEHQSVLPDKVRRWLGLATNYGQLKEPIDGQYSLMALNDGAKYSFVQIAEVIKKGLVQ